MLLENDEEPDAIGDEVRSILDGHIYLSPTLASQGHYPAIDILRSTSRLFLQITDQKQQRAAVRFLDLLVRQWDMHLYLDLGEYRRGENEENDNAFDKKMVMSEFLRQPLAEHMELTQTLEQMNVWRRGQ